MGIAGRESMSKALTIGVRLLKDIDFRRFAALAVLTLGSISSVIGVCPGIWSSSGLTVRVPLVDPERELLATPSFLSDSVSEPASQPRSLYPYSVIPGGVANGAELRAAIASDSVVRAHYAGFRLANATVVRLGKPQLMYVSYRIGNQVFWSKRPTLLAAGERVISDGHEMARTRCGNRVSAFPAAPIAPAGAPGDVAPEAMELPAADGPMDAAAMPIDVPVVQAPTTAVLIPPSVPPMGTVYLPPGFWFPPGGGTTYSSGPGTVSPGTPGTPGTPGSPGSPGTPPISAPEPNSVVLLLIGVAGVFLLRRAVRASH